MRILVAEDDATLGAQVRDALRQDGRAVDVATDGEEAAFLATTEPYDLVVLDLGLPKKDGMTVLREMRTEGVTTPVMILTARTGWSDRVDGLDAGADDYVPKPFNMAEFQARVRAILRRNAGRSAPVFERAGVRYETRTSRVWKDGTLVKLSAQETAVLSYLFHHAGRPISQTELSEHIYEYDGERDSNTIAVFINRLRRKLGADFIVTVRGQGYVLPEA